MNDHSTRYGRCIFCGDYKRLTEEHVWPQWVRDHIQFDEDVFGKASVDVYPDREEVVSNTEHRGDPRARPVQKVCADCNGGWMSALQQRAKSELTPLIHGLPYSMTEDGQRVVAAWVTMTVMTAEFFFPGVIAIPPVERLSMKLTSSPLRNWKIWIASYKRENWRAHFARTTRPLLFEGMPDPPDGEVPERNTQASTFVIGQAYFHAFSCPEYRYTDILELQCDGLVQMWPAKTILTWPTSGISDIQADRIAGFIFQAIDGGNFRSIPIPSQDESRQA